MKSLGESHGQFCCDNLWLRSSVGGEESFEIAQHSRALVTVS